VTIWLKGSVIEHMLDGSSKKWGAGRIKYTSKNTFHKVESLSDTLALSIRGPWVDKWNEFRNGKLVTLTHGRHVL
jgi:ribosomal protein S4E